MGFFGKTYQLTGWQAPPDWPSLSDCALGNIEMIVNDQTMATYAFNCTTADSSNYQINWGDGTVLPYASGATAQHTYVIGSGTPCSLGYTTFNITISPTAGNLTGFNITTHSLATNTQYQAVLSAWIRATYLTSLSNAFYCSSGALACCRQLESCIVSDIMPSCTTATSMFQNCNSLQSVNVSGMTAVTTATSMFQSCNSLQSVNVSGMTAVTTATNMFQSCYSLQSVNVSGMTAVTTATNMFQSCYSLQSVNVSGMTAVTTATSMFQYCYSLQSVNVSGMTAVTTATSMFNGCYSLSTVTTTNFAAAASSVQCDQMFEYCEQLTTINLGNAKVTVIQAEGQSGKLNKLATVTFSPFSTFSYGTAPQLDVSYTTMTAAQINTLLAALPGNLAKTVKITGATGDVIVTPGGTQATTTGSTTVTTSVTTGLTVGMEVLGAGLNTPPTCAATVSSSLFTSTAHGIPNATLIYFTGLSTVTGLTVNTPYYVVNSTANTFQVSLTSGGAAITLGGSNGTVTPYHGNTILTVNAGVSIITAIPASATGSPAITASNVLRSLAIGRSWTVTT